MKQTHINWYRMLDRSKALVGSERSIVESILSSSPSSFYGDDVCSNSEKLSGLLNDKVLSMRMNIYSKST